MSKKAILSALLVSSALLGATAANAATSDIKAESKKVTVCTDKVKLYKDSKLKESTTPKNGTVYQVDGYRDIDGKHVYRVYQTDKEGKKAYRGYIDSKDTKDFNGQKASGQFVLKGNVNVWKNFYWTEKNTNTAERVVFAKYEYTLGNGQKYYSVYTKDADGKDVWQGYTTKSNLKEVTSTKESKYVTLKKNTKSFANLYFQQTKGSFDASKGVNFKVTRYYTIDGKKYYSTEQAKEAWTGYVDSSVVEDLKAEKVATADSKVKVAKEWNTYSDHFYTKKAKLADYKDKTLTAKYTYTYGNGKKYASLYDGDTWVGYANVEALTFISEDVTSVDVENLQNAFNDLKELAKNVYLTKKQETKLNEEFTKLQNEINEAKKGNKEQIDAVKAKLEQVGKELKTQPSETEGNALNKALESAKKLDKYGDILFQNFDKVKKAYDDANKTMNELKKDPKDSEPNKATTPLTAANVEQVTKALNDALNNLQINADNTKWFYNQAKTAIQLLNKDDQTKANEVLKAFEGAAKKGTAKDFKEIVESANNLVNAINDAQNKELKAVIDKANEIIKENDEAKPGNQGTNEDFYTKDSYAKLKEAVAEAQKALDLKVSDIHKDNMYDKQTTKVALNNAIKGLKLANWDYKEENGKVVLTKYKPLAIDENQKEKNGIIYRQDKIVIPGKLKDMPVVLDITEEDNYLYPIIKTDIENGKVMNAQKVTVTFKEVSGQKVTTGDKLLGTFAYMGPVDVSGLDTSNVTMFFKTFCGNASTEIKGIEGLNTSKATDFTSMFADAKNLTSLDLSQWDMTNATKLGSMFFDTPKLTNLNLKDWNLKSVHTKYPQSSMFGKKSQPNEFCGVIKVNPNGSTGKDKVSIVGLTFPTDAHSKTVIDMALDDSITGTMDHTKPKK